MACRVEQDSPELWNQDREREGGEKEERRNEREGGEREGGEREGGERGREQASSPIHFQWSILSLNSTTGRKKGRGSKEESAPTSAEM